MISTPFILHSKMFDTSQGSRLPSKRKIKADLDQKFPPTKQTIPTKKLSKRKKYFAVVQKKTGWNIAHIKDETWKIAEY